MAHSLFPQTGLIYGLSEFTYDGLTVLLKGREWPLFREGVQLRTFCPVCEGDGSNSPSLSIKRGMNGTPVFFCFSGKGCGLDRKGDARDPKDFRRALEAFKTALVPTAAGRKYERRSVRGTDGRVRSRGREVARYEYPNGKIKVRYEHADGWNKDFRWPRGKGEPMLYRPPTRAEKQEVVFIVEGEKDADRLSDLDLVATTVSEGHLSKALARRYLKGCFVAILWDYDEHGFRARDAALSALEGVAEKAFPVRLPGLKKRRDHGQDVSDWLDHCGGTREGLVALVGRVL